MPTITLPPKDVHIIAVIVASLTAIGSIIAVIEGALPKGSSVSSGLAVGAGVLGQTLIALKLVEARASGTNTAITTQSATLVSGTPKVASAIEPPKSESQPAIESLNDDQVSGELDALSEPSTPAAGLAPSNG